MHLGCIFPIQWDKKSEIFLDCSIVISDGIGNQDDGHIDAMCGYDKAYFDEPWIKDIIIVEISPPTLRIINKLKIFITNNNLYCWKKWLRVGFFLH